MAETLLPQHAALIAASGITAEVAAERGYWSATSLSALERIGFGRAQRRTPALVLPIYDARGELVSYQIRPDAPRVNRDDRPIKYESIAGGQARLDVPPRARAWLGDPQIPLFVTEGIRKADAAVSRGLCCVALLGVWNWRGSNDLGGRTALPDWEHVALNGRPVYVVFDSDVMSKRDVHAALVRLQTFLGGRGAQVRLVYLPAGAHGEKVGLDDWLAAGNAPEALVGLAVDEARAAPDAGQPPDEESGEALPYREAAGGIWWRQPGPEGPHWRRLTEFTARIMRDVLEDDGSGREPTPYFEVECQCGPRAATAMLPAEEFDALAWPARLLGSKAAVLPGQHIQAHTRYAIRKLSPAASVHRVYTHLGWRRREDGGWTYLHHGGGLDAEGAVGDVETRLPSGMHRYALPAPVGGEALREAVRRSLAFLTIAPEAATLPLLAAVYTAPLGEMLSTDFIVWLYGETGARKSSIAAAALSHFGDFERSTLPANFTSTVYSIEEILHTAKDVLLVVDDYAPPVDRRSRDQMEAIVHRLLRSVGDSRGRNRLSADAKLKGERPCRGLPMVTAELRPPGVQSAEARTVEVYIERAQVDLEALTRAQEEDREHYGAAMAGYLCWLASQWESLAGELPRWVRRKGQEFAAKGGIGHGRVAESAAKLCGGLSAFARFAFDCGAISEEEMGSLVERGMAAILGAARHTCGHQEERRPSKLALSYLESVFFQRQGYLRDRATGRLPAAEEAESWGCLVAERHQGEELVLDVSHAPGAEPLGWVDEDHLYLKPIETHRAIVRYTRAGDIHFPAARDDLGEALRRDGITVCEGKRTSGRVSIRGEDVRVWKIPRERWRAELDAGPPGAAAPPDIGSDRTPTAPTNSDRTCGRSAALLPVGESGTPTAPTAVLGESENMRSARGGEGLGEGEERGGTPSHPTTQDDHIILGRSGRSSSIAYSPNGFAPTAPRSECGRSRSEPRSEGDDEGERTKSQPAEAPSVVVGSCGAAPPPAVITEASELGPLLGALERAERVGLDLETTGLSPRKDRIRLISLATREGTWVVDCATCDPGPVAALLEERPLVCHNAKFDLGFLMQAGFQPHQVEDTMLLSQLLHAGQPAPKGTHTLAGVARRWLNLELAKELQRSNWAGALTQAQLEYAGRDAAVLIPLHARLMAAAAEADIERAAAIEMRALPAVVWMTLAGVPLERNAWLALEAAARAEQARIEDEMNAVAPKPPGLDLGVPWQWGNPAIVKRVLGELGIEVTSTADDVLAGLDHPLAALLRKHRKQGKLISTYGASWPEGWEDGRIYPDWRQLGAEATGRMSCSGPNVQQVPREPGYRECIAAPSGRVLVTADYSQIELRIAARVAGEKRMLAAYAEGQDLHKLTASMVLNKPISQETKGDRQIAKSLNFGLLYGMGAPSLQIYAKTNYGVELGPQEALRYREAFFGAYPGLRAWHNRVREAHAMEIRTLTGRRRTLAPADYDTVRLNTPVQGTGADGLKQALALLWERREACPGAVPVIACHDEIVVECDAGQADAAVAWVKQAMVDGMQALVAPVPVEVEPGVGPRWEK